MVTSIFRKPQNRLVMKPQTILVIILCFSVVSIYGQSNKRLDSLLQAYQTQPDDTLKVKTQKKLFDAYINNDLQEAKKYALAELQLSQKLNYKKGAGMANLHLGVIYDYKAQRDSATMKYQLAKQLFEEIEDYGNVAVTIQNIASVEYAMGNYEQALAITEEGIELVKTKVKIPARLIPFYHLKGLIHRFLGNYQIAMKEVLKVLELLEDLDRPITKADALNLLAQLEHSQKHYKQSIAYNEDAVDIYKKYNDKSFECTALNDIGNSFYYLKEYPNAIKHLALALPLSREMEMPDVESSILTNLGKTNIKLKKYQKGITYLKEGLEIVQKTKAKNKIAETLNELGIAFTKTNKLNIALGYLNQSIEISDSTTAKAPLAAAYLYRAKAYAKSNKPALAYQDHLMHKQLTDAIYDETKSKQIQELKTIYETEKKEQEIAQQATKISLLEQQEKVSTLQKTVLGGGLGLSFLVFGFGFYGIRQKMKRNKVEKEKVEAALAFKQKELTTHALHLAKKNEVLEGLKQKAQALKKEETDGKGYHQLIKIIDFDLKDDNNWEQFTKYFQEVHQDFNSMVSKKYPDISPNDLRLMSLIKMNLSSKEMANILNISMAGIKKARQRLRKKMGLETKDSLEKAVLSIA